MNHISLALKCVKFIRLRSVHSFENPVVWLISSNAGVTKNRIITLASIDSVRCNSAHIVSYTKNDAYTY